MANEFKISEIVDEAAVRQVQQLKSELVALKEEYVGLATKLANKLTVNAASFTELAKEGKDVNGILAQIADTEGKMAETSKQINIINVQMAKNISEVRKQLQEENKIVQSNEKAKQAVLNTAKAESALATQIARQKKAEAVANKDVAVTAEQAEAAYKKEVKTIKEAQEANKILRAYVKQLDTTTKEGKKEIEKFNDAIDKNTKRIKENSDAYINQKMNVGNYAKSIEKAWDKVKDSFGDIKKEGVNAKNTMGLMMGLADGISASFSGAAGGVVKLAGAFGLFKGLSSVIGIINSGVKTAIDFEAANSKLAAILGTTSAGIRELTEEAQRLGRTTSFTASQVTELQTELAKLGFTADEIKASESAILSFAKATGSDLGSAASVAGAALRMFGASAEETARYVSTMAVATTKSALSFSDLQSSLSTVGPVAAAFGFEIEDTVTLMGMLKNAGFDASSAATATRNILLNLADSSGKLAKKLGEPVRNIEELQNALIKLRDANIPLAESLDLTDKRSVSAFNAFIKQAGSLVDLRSQVTGAEKDFNAMSDTMGNNVQGSINKLSSAWEGFMLTVVKSTGWMKSAIDIITDAVSRLRELMTDEFTLIGEAGKEYIELGKKEAAEMEAVNVMIDEAANRRKAYILSGMKDADAQEKANKEVLEIAKQQWKDAADTYNENARRVNELNKKFRDGEIKYGSKAFHDMEEELDKSRKLIEEYGKAYGKAIATYNALNSKINKPAIPGSADNDYTSDNVRKLLEKEAKEREKIQQALNDSIVELMEDGLEKELAKIRSSYEKKMAQYKGNSENEKELRLNLSLKMTEEIEKKTLSYQLSEIEKSIKLRKESMAKGTSEYLSAEIQLLQVNYRKKTELENVSIQERIALFEKYERDYTELVTEFEEKRKNEHLESISNSISMTATLMSARMEAELNALKQSYSNGEITENEYNKTVAEMKVKYAKNSAEETVKYLEDVLKSETLTDEEREDLELKLAKARMDLSDAVANNEIQNNKAILESQKKAIRGSMEIVEYVADAVDSVAELGNRLYQNQLDKLKEQQDEVNTAYDEEEERINELEENGSITTEEAEARKRAAKDRTQKKNEEIARKQEEIEKKQARLAKATAIAQAIMSTALAVMRVYADPGNGGFISRGIMAGIVSALGAMQLATIVATPLAAYKEGTNDHKGGMAIVGDGGRPEVISYNGKAWITPGVPTLVNMPKHAQVFPDIASYESMKPMISSDYLSLSKSHSDVKLVNDFSSLQKSIESGNKESVTQTRILRVILKQNKESAFDRYIKSRI